MSAAYEVPKIGAEVICAMLECDEETRGVLKELAAIVVDPDANDDDKRTSWYTIEDLLFPGRTADFVDGFERRLQEPDAIAAKAQVKASIASFGENVRARMKERGWTQQRLAEAAGATQPAVANLLSRTCYPQARTVEKFAKAFGIAPQELWPHYEPATEQDVE